MGAAAPPQSPSWAWAEEDSYTDALAGTAPPHECVSFSLRVTATLNLSRPCHWLLCGPSEDKTLSCILLSAQLNTLALSKTMFQLELKAGENKTISEFKSKHES